MTPIDLQDELVEEVKRILSDYLYKAPSGKRVPMNVYPQNIPVNETGDDADSVPYVIVRLSAGDSDIISAHDVKVLFIIATWDDALNNQGHRDVMNIVDKIYYRFATNPNVNGKGAFNGKFNWALQDDDYYPYSFGACSLNFDIAAIRREDPLT